VYNCVSTTCKSLFRFKGMFLKQDFLFPATNAERFNALKRVTQPCQNREKE